MITDRTIEDVQNAARIRDEKIKIFQELTEDDIETLERGMMTVNTLNRIEKKQAELKELLKGMGYWSKGIVNKTDRTNTDIFYKEDFKRIIDNENILKQAFFVYKDTPNTPDISFGYEEINALEKILEDLENMIKDVKKSYRECGMTESGEM